MSTWAKSHISHLIDFFPSRRCHLAILVLFSDFAGSVKTAMLDVV